MQLKVPPPPSPVSPGSSRTGVLQAGGAGGVEAQGDVRTGSVGAPGQSLGAGRLTIGMGVGPDAGLPARPRQLGEPLGVELDHDLPQAAAPS